MKRFLAAVAFVSIVGLASDAYAGICIGRQGSICIGSAEFCTACRGGSRVSGFQDSLVSVQGKSFFASNVDVTEVDGTSGLVTIRQGEKIIFDARIDLAEVLISDVETGGYLSLAEVAIRQAMECSN